MGTSGAYTGAGGKAGREVQDGLGDWIDSLPLTPDDGDSTPSPDDTAEGSKPVTQFPPKVVSGLMDLLRPQPTRGGSSDGPSAGGGGVETREPPTPGGGGRIRAGSGRSSHRLAIVGGRAAAGAYAYVSGDSAGLFTLGLDYDELQAIDDPLEVTRRIVNAVCGQQANGRLEEAEERYVAASVAGWVLEQSENGELPDVDDVARYAIAAIVTEVLSSELGAVLRDRPDEVTDVPEGELRDAAMVIARQAELNILGPTENELTGAIEEGLEKLRSIYGNES